MPRAAWAERTEDRREREWEKSLLLLLLRLNFQVPNCERRGEERGVQVLNAAAAAAAVGDVEQLFLELLRREENCVGGGKWSLLLLLLLPSPPPLPLGGNESQYASLDTFSGDFLRSFCPAVVAGIWMNLGFVIWDLNSWLEWEERLAIG